MRRKKKNHNMVLRVAAVLACLTLGSAWKVCGLYARFTSSDAGQDSGRVGAFVFDLSDQSSAQGVTHMITLNDVTKPGDSQTYHFTISNQNGNMVSEVAENYQIQLDVEGSLPIICTVAKDTEEICKVDTTDETSGTGTASGSEIAFEAANVRSDQYTLTAQWPGTVNDVKYANSSGTSLVRLTVKAQQTD